MKLKKSRETGPARGVGRNHGTSLFCPEVRPIIIRDPRFERRTVRFTSPKEFVPFVRKLFADSPWFDPAKEALVVVALDRHGRPLGFNLVSIGTATATLAGPPEIFRPLVALGATNFVLAHNHPSGDPRPSEKDYALTVAIKQASEIMQIRFIDHLVVAVSQAAGKQKSYFSFYERKLL